MPLLEDETPAACDNDIIFQHMETLLNNCTTQGISNAVAAQSSGAGIAGVRRTSEILQAEGEIRMHTLASLDEEVGSTSLRGVEQEERRLRRRRVCHTTRPTLMTIMLCCYNTAAFSYCGSPTNTNRRALQTSTVAPSTSPISAADVEKYLPAISAECSTQFQTLAQSYININPAAECFASAADVAVLTCYAVMVTGGTA
jgi:hypothetical protein